MIFRGKCSHCGQLRPVQVIEDEVFVDDHEIYGHHCLGSGTPTEPIRATPEQIAQIQSDVLISREQYFALEDEYVQFRSVERDTALFKDQATELRELLRRLRDLRLEWYEEWKKQAASSVVS